jgi:hypothetical protein
MTVSTSDITSGPYTGNGLSDEYSYDFTVQNKAHLEVFETTDAGVRTTLTVDVDYTVNNVGTDGGGTITRLAGNLPTDYIWYIRADYPEDQTTDFTALGPFSPAIHELQFDHLTYLVKQLSDKLGRALTFTKELVAPVGVDLTLPAPVAGKIAAMWDSAGTALEIGPSADEISGAQGYAVAAAQSVVDCQDILDEFNGQYFGALANEAAATALTPDLGDQFWDISAAGMKVYNGSAWELTSTALGLGSGIALADAADYYAVDNVENALQEVGAEFAALPTKVETLENKELTNPTINGKPAYGLVILDTPIMLQFSSTDSGSWQTHDMSAGPGAIAATDGARIAILRGFVEQENNNGTQDFAMVCARPVGSSNGTGNLTQIVSVEGALNATPGDSLKDNASRLINLDANGDFEYYFVENTSGMIGYIYLDGYYV